MKDKFFKDRLLQVANKVLNTPQEGKALNNIKIWAPILTGIAALLIAIVSLIQNQRISDQEQTIKNFDSLLKNTQATLDKLITTNNLLKDQLELNRTTQEQANIRYKKDAIGNKNNFIAAVLHYGEILNLWDLEIHKEGNLNMTNTYISDFESYYINEITKILLSQLNNPFLIQNKQLNNAWTDAYKHITYLTNDNVFDSSFSVEFYGRPGTLLDSIENNVKRDLKSCRESINRAYLLSAKYITTQ